MFHCRKNLTTNHEITNKVCLSSTIGESTNGSSTIKINSIRCVIRPGDMLQMLQQILRACVKWWYLDKFSIGFSLRYYFMQDKYKAMHKKIISKTSSNNFSFCWFSFTLMGIVSSHQALIQNFVCKFCLLPYWRRCTIKLRPQQYLAISKFVLNKLLILNL